MPTVSFKPRNGKNLFEFLQRSMIEPNQAINWAIEEFVLIDGKPVDIVAISKLNDQAYLMISSKLFPMNSTDVYEDNEGIHYQDILIKNRKITRNFVTELQTTNKGTNEIGLMKKCITTMFNTSIAELEQMPFQVTAFLINKINFFLGELTTPRDEFSIETIWSESAKESTVDELDNMV